MSYFLQQTKKAQIVAAWVLESLCFINSQNMNFNCDYHLDVFKSWAWDLNSSGAAGESTKGQASLFGLSE